MSRQNPKTILIVCEGEGTEPNYFNKLRDILIDENLNVSIEIKPRPKEESVIEELFKLRPGGKKRIIQDIDNQLHESVIEEKYKAQPTRYVREAQKGLEDGTYEEVWAVFDKDGHPRHLEAFELADVKINDKKVNIAFNSLAFEFWILLHFENNNTAFEKSMCRIDKKPLLCGAKIHDDDCKGEKCISGRIVSQKHLKYENDRKEFDFRIFHPHVNDAIIRANKLRKLYYGNEIPVYKLNPYTSTDKLVYKLLNLRRYDLNWFDFSETQHIHNLNITFSFKEKILQIDIAKLIERTEIIHGETFCLFDAEGNKLVCGHKKIMTEAQFQIFINVGNIQNFSPLNIGIRINDFQYLISELPF